MRVLESDLQHQQLQEDLASSGLLLTDRPERNILLFKQVPAKPGGRAAKVFMPYYLLDLPIDDIVDLMYNRLAPVTIVNLGRVTLALENAGYTVQLSQSNDQASETGLRTFTTFEGPDGKIYTAELPDIAFSLTRMIYEYRGIEFLLDIMQTMKEAAIVASQLLPSSGQE